MPTGFKCWVSCKFSKIKKRPGFYTLTETRVFYISINNSRSKQNKKYSEHSFVDIGN